MIFYFFLSLRRDHQFIKKEFIYITPLPFLIGSKDLIKG
jgi:hypothetical protein